MLRELRRRMALINILTTGIVFAAVMLVMAALSEAQYRQVNEASFLNDVASITNKLQTEESVSSAWLARTETDERYIIAVESNGSPFHFRGAWTPASPREALVAKAREEARKAGGMDYGAKPAERGQVNLMSMRGSGGDLYRCAVALVPMEENWFSLTVLGDLSPEKAVIAGQRLLYGGISLAVLGTLALFSWWFSGKAVRPAAESMKKQKEFIAAASHELRTPLTVIRTSVSAMGVKPEKNARLMKNIEDECGQMARLVDDMLLLANMDAKSWTMRHSEVELDTVLIDVTERFRELAQNQGFRLTLGLPEEMLPVIHGDVDRLTQILSILLSNAIDYAGQSGEIRVEAAAVLPGVQIDVIDHGKGIPAQERERVFDRFYRADKSRTGKKHFGLGLSIAWELAQMHGGTLTLLETPGGGCTFRLTLS